MLALWKCGCCDRIAGRFKLTLCARMRKLPSWESHHENIIVTLRENNFVVTNLKIAKFLTQNIPEPIYHMQTFLPPINLPPKYTKNNPTGQNLFIKYSCFSILKKCDIIFFSGWKNALIFKRNVKFWYCSMLNKFWDKQNLFIQKLFVNLGGFHSGNWALLLKK